MKPPRLLLAALVALASLCPPAWAQAPATSASAVPELSRCLADNTSGRDRKELARWVFVAMAAHPEMKPYASSAATGQAEEVHRAMAATFTRLLAESCLKQTQAAFRSGGAAAIQAAFETLGQLAMQELMSHPDVNANMSAFERFIDQARLNKAFSRE